MQQQYLGIFTRHEYKDISGVTQTKWYKAGYMKLTENGGRFIRFFHQPKIDFYCFDSDPNEVQTE